MKRHINIPVFIPHVGCKNSCVFCNQRSISGKSNFDISLVKKELERAVSTIDYQTSEVEIAFFGGSFTGIDREDMIYLLSLAREYIDMGKAQSVRLSTRPDYINEEILDILKAYRVTDIELGLQSMNDEVLTASKRGHNSNTARYACRLIKDYGFNLVGQMMIGLPLSTGELEVDTARELVKLGCDGARIYPTVVFYDTELCEMAKRGEYIPLTLDDAVERSANVLEIFVRAGIPVIRLGLCASDNLSSDSIVYGGANHSALGELVYSELYYKKFCNLLCEYEEKDRLEDKTVRFAVPAGETSKAVGQKRKNIIRLMSRYKIKQISFTENASLEKYNVELFPVN